MGGNYNDCLQILGMLNYSYPNGVKRTIRVRRQQHVVGLRRSNTSTGRENFAVGTEEADGYVDEHATDTLQNQI